MSAQTPEGSVIITPMMMFITMQSLSSKVDHIETLLDPSLRDIRKDVGDHETRLRGIEKRVWMFGGATMFISSVVAILAGHYKW